ncbi:hypothetical protein FACS1894151_04560 [Spirochaetia bacterium]|nr:hypothetical protein FACS1894151_04560 [Spirochaetia bacterium]
MVSHAQEEPQLNVSRLEILKKKINTEEYLSEAIQRIALVLSNELLDMSNGGNSSERYWKSRRRPRG